MKIEIACKNPPYKMLLFGCQQGKQQKTQALARKELTAMKKSIVAANSYTVDFAAHKIIATSEFMAKAGQYGSAEYTTIMNLRKDLPDFKIEVLADKKPNKKKGCLNLDTMEAYIIRTFGEDSAEIQEFRKVREEAKVKKTRHYSYMKQWFHAVYPEGYKLLCELDDGEVKKQERRENARKAVETAVAMRNAVSKENSFATQANSAATEKPSADYEESAEELAEDMDF